MWYDREDDEHDPPAYEFTTQQAVTPAVCVKILGAASLLLVYLLLA